MYILSKIHTEMVTVGEIPTKILINFHDDFIKHHKLIWKCGELALSLEK